MGTAPRYERIRWWISDIAFAIFLWANRVTEDEYRDSIWEDMLDYESDFRRDPSNY
jgi:hypothetical protein